MCIRYHLFGIKWEMIQISMTYLLLFFLLFFVVFSGNVAAMDASCYLRNEELSLCDLL